MAQREATGPPAWLPAVLAAVPALAGVGPDGVQVGPVGGGITNDNWRLEAGGRSWFVRIAGADTDLLGIDRPAEAASATRAAELGLAPPVVCALADPEGLVTDFLDRARVARPADLGRDPVLAQVAGHLRRFHDSGPLPSTFPVFDMIGRHGADAAARGVALPEEMATLTPAVADVRAALATARTGTAACHNDLLTGNFLLEPRRDGTDRVWIVDYEYAGMNDRHFDLGNLAQHHGFDDDRVAFLVEAYFGATTAARVARVELMRLVSSVREGMWGVVQSAISALDVDFGAYASEHLGAALERARDPRHRGWLAAAAVPDPPARNQADPFDDAHDDPHDDGAAHV